METKTFLMTTSYYPPYHIGGDAVCVKYLSEELVKLGHEVHVMFSLDAYRYKRPEFRDHLKQIEESNGVILHPLQAPLGRSELYLTYLFGKSSYVKKRFDGLLEKNKPDVVHHHNIFFLGYDILKKQGNYTNLYTAHDYWLICQRYDLMNYGRNECKKRSCLSCTLLARRLPQIWRGGEEFREAVRDIDAIIAPSIFMKEKLSLWLPVESNIVHIPNFIPSPPKDIVNSKYSNYFLYVGVLEKHKGICNLLKVFSEYRNEIHAKLIIVGNGSLKKKIEEYIKKYSLGNKVIFLDWLAKEEIWPLYKDALALVVPSTGNENNPLVALEALSMGTPVIGTDNGGLGEIIKRINKNLFLTDDGADVFKAILNYNNNSSKERIKEIYKQCYSSDYYLNEYFKNLRIASI